MSLGGLIAFIGSVRYTELVIAKQKLKEDIHYRKWSPVENVLFQFINVFIYGGGGGGAKGRSSRVGAYQLSDIL